MIVSYESVRRWCLKFGPRYQRSLKRREGTLGDDWFVDEVFIAINGGRLADGRGKCSGSKPTAMLNDSSDFTRA